MTHYPDNEIVAEHRKLMNDLAGLLDTMFNPKGKKNCFILLVTPFGGDGDGRCNYISNGARSDVILMLKEITSRFEGKSEKEAKADASLAQQLQRSMELNARMKNRLNALLPKLPAADLETPGNLQRDLQLIINDHDPID
jgi:hypothetical protein